MRQPFGHGAARAGGVALLVSLLPLLLCAGAVALGLKATRTSREEVLRRDDNIRLLQVLQRDVRMAETGQRGYLLVNDPAYLQPYRAALARIPEDLADLKAAGLVAGAAVPRLEALIADKLAELALTIRLHDEAPDSALSVVRSDLGQRYMNAIDNQVAALVAQERARLREDTLRLDRRADRTALATSLGAALALLAGALGLVLVLRQRRTDALQALNATLEARVAERTERLTQANQELDAFAYTISHDLRAPLRAISGYTEVIEEDAGERLEPELRGYLGRIAASAEQMNRLIQDILAYSKLAKEDLSVRAVDLDALVTRARQQLTNECAGAQIDVAAPLGEVMGHPAALQQVVENLLSNACKYVRPGTPARICLRTEPRDDCRRLWVEDEGIGIVPEQYERIFRPFERLHGIEAYPGTGIGLAIVQRSMERMGGRCGVQAAPQGGSAFWIELREPPSA